MLLVVDIGNSQTSFGIFEKNQLRFHWRAKTEVARTADEYASLLFPLFAHAGLGGDVWEGIALCSVVPAADMAFEAFCESYLQRTPFKVSSDGELGFSVEVDVPSEVGADRLANGAYAIKHLSLPAIVVDIGTATTFDVISGKRAWEGGVILPGVRLMTDSLSAKTAKLPLIDLEFIPSVIGKNTTDCIRSGILYGYCDLLDGLIARITRELGGKAEVALTGGHAFLFKDRLRHANRYLPNLTLEGIQILYRKRAN